MAERESVAGRPYCGDIDEKYIGKHITVFGWVQVKRELGGITFIDLRDREGLLQVVFNGDFPHRGMLRKIGREFVLEISGEVVRRSNPNPDIFTGQVELVAEDAAIVSESEVPPFFPENRSGVSEELRFKYRYLDLRNLKLQRNFKTRSDVNLKVRNYMDAHGFIDIETPVLTKATPEGARDYLVPSRIYKTKMFALPQSPQLFKQLLMVSGFDRYYQITKCFRDEDLRADRQPEFTQIDIEMSFAEPRELKAIINGLMNEIFHREAGTDVEPFKSLTYDQAISQYGTDRPDLRIPFQIGDFTDSTAILKSSLLNAIREKKGIIKGLVIPESRNYSRKKLDALDHFIRDLGGQGVIWLKHGEHGFNSSLKIDPSDIDAFFSSHSVDKDQIIFLIGGPSESTHFLLGKLREHLGKRFQDKNRLEFCWITDFPLFFYNQEEKKLDSNHHPFTSPRQEDLEKLDSDPLRVRSIAYDLVLNGVEIGGGSQRIKDLELQKKIFRLLDLSEPEIEEKFGFFLNALRYGAPPHLGIALGFDRIIMLLTGEESIREVIAFPKTTSSLCLMTGSPSRVTQSQLEELGIRFNKK